MISFKNKIQILKTLKTESLDLSEIDKYLGLLECKSLAAPVLDKLIETLIDLDVQMTAIYETVEEEDWQDIISDYATPIEKQTYRTVRENIKLFVASYTALEEITPKLDLNILFAALSKVPLCKTSTLQFLFFSIAIYKPTPVLCFFLDNIKDKPCVYVPYFVSFVCRISKDCSKAIESYIKWVRSLKKGKNLIYVQATQGLMYLCCFKKEYIAPCSDIFNGVFRENIYSLMNPNVVEKFCSLTPYEFKLFRSLENVSLYFFPFDKSILDTIHELYEDFYVEFE
ncbi:hypothetical protein NGRA_2416 [Nosema granulosis]|uniref:Uncharacterized protein n=1 Tax=Nosema granulosis TaxID=83296 RepID=A0A9P6GWP5_9MICR|nr:hypothetical protein NGRA_2416 [Nosema granulosis]